MKRNLLVVAAASAAAPILAFSPAAHGAVATLVSSRDNTLYEDALGGLSNGIGQEMFVGTTSTSNHRRSLVYFDLTPLRPGARINSVSVTITSDQSHTTPYAVELHRATSNWGEGTSDAGVPGGFGASSTPGDATWIHTFYNTNFWTTPGGDFSPTSSASVTVGAPGAYTWASTPQLVADAQSWVKTPANNFGWLLKLNDEVTLTSAKRFATRENLTLANRPMLTVNYNIGGDANLDNVVNVNDFTILASNFGQTNRTFEQGDFNLDTVVNVNDFTILASNFGISASGPNGTVSPQDWANLAAAMVPEPGLGSLVLLGVIAPIRRSRRRR